MHRGPLRLNATQTFRRSPSLLRSCNFRRHNMHNNLTSTAAPAAGKAQSGWRRSAAALSCALPLAGFAAVTTAANAAEAPQCELDRPNRFAGMNWETNLVLVEIERYIAEKGYGCKSEVMPVETLPALAA